MDRGEQAMPRPARTCPVALTSGVPGAAARG